MLCRVAIVLQAVGFVKCSAWVFCHSLHLCAEGNGSARVASGHLAPRMFSCTECGLPYAGGVRGLPPPEPPAGALPLDPECMLLYAKRHRPCLIASLDAALFTMWD